MLLHRLGISASPRLRTLSACRASALALLVTAGVTVPVAGAQTAHDSSGTTTTSSSGSGGSTGSGSGGSGLGATPTPTSGGPSTPAPAAAEVVTLAGPQQVDGDGITLSVAQFGELNHILQITGSAPATDAGQTIQIEGTTSTTSTTSTAGTTSTGTGTTWTVLARATIAPNGSFSAAWIPLSSATYTLQATLAPAASRTGSPATQTQTQTQTGGGALPADDTPADAADASALTATATFTLPVFKLSTASFYGPGLWGRRTACGEVLRRSTLGVANRTLPCGTMVAVYFRGRELSVPVIDRGPYQNHASWDLTYAAAKALEITETSQVGTLAPAPATLSAAVRRGG